MTDRSNDYNSNIENVIFLGAGASKADGAPQQNELFKEYFKLPLEYTSSNSVELLERLGTFFNSFFGINLNELEYTNFPTFEEALGVLEIALNRGESFKGYGLSADNPDIQRIRQDLIFLMAITIDNKLNIVESHHKNLVKTLDKQKSLSKTAFISLNYDILIDNALVDRYPYYDLDYGVEFTNFWNNQECSRSDNSWKRPNSEKSTFLYKSYYDSDYGFEFANLWNNQECSSPDNSWKRPRPEKSIFLYKLHGSLNWLYCPTCIALKLTPKEKSVPSLALKSEKCKKCGSAMIPIIIPPTFFKVMSNFYLQQIWYKSEIALRQAKNIIFCGYSFSDADIHVKYLLKRAEINNGHTPEIYIINSHSTKTGEEKKTEKERYKRFFNVKDKVHYMDQSFEDFCCQGIDRSKEI